MHRAPASLEGRGRLIPRGTTHVRFHGAEQRRTALLRAIGRTRKAYRHATRQSSALQLRGDVRPGLIRAARTFPPSLGMAWVYSSPSQLYKSWPHVLYPSHSMCVNQRDPAGLQTSLVGGI